MQLGFLQFAPELGNPQANINKIDELVKDVSLPELLVLPELCNSGYNFTSHQQAQETAEPVHDSPFINFLTTLCQKHNSHIVSGLNERDGDLLYNSAVLVGPEGYIGRYRKLHLFYNEKDHFQPGDAGLPIFEIDSFKIGMLVCFDWTFPEVWRILTIKGAEIICHPSNLVLPGKAQKGVPVHAMINRIYTITANRTGQEGDLRFTGLSTIAGPTGEVLSQAGEDEDALQSIEIFPCTPRDKWITDRNHVLEDRRPEEYSLLVKS